jgi:hypothetical protein
MLVTYKHPKNSVTEHVILLAFGVFTDPNSLDSGRRKKEQKQTRPGSSIR